MHESMTVDDVLCQVDILEIVIEDKFHFFKFFFSKILTLCTVTKIFKEG
jgi:hypothetical protein